MGSSGRFGKYGESKRLKRLRDSRDAAVPAKKTPGPPDRRKSGFQQAAQKKQHTSIRPAGGRDAPFIHRLSREVFEIYGPYGSLVSQWFATGTATTLVACVDGVPAGFAMMGRASGEQGAPDVAELLAVAVSPEYQRRGVGTTLMQAIERAARQQGVRSIILHTSADNRSAQKLFAGSGFRILGLREDFYPEGQDALCMIRDMALPGERAEQQIF